MNVLLLFAFFATVLSVWKDFIDSNGMWKNKNLFSIILSTLALIPLIVNFLVFTRSEKFCMKDIKFNFLKFLLMDNFEGFMIKRCIQFRGTFCNQSSIYATEFFGGEAQTFSSLIRSNDSQILNNENYEIKINIKSFHDFLKNSNKMNKKVIYECDIIGSTLNFIKLVAEIVTVLVESDIIVKTGSDNNHFSFCNDKDEEVFMYHPSDFNLNWDKEVVIKMENKDLIVTVLFKTFKINGDITINFFNGDTSLLSLVSDPRFKCKIGILDLEIIKDRVIFNYKGKQFDSFKHNLNWIKLIKLRNILEHWQNNPNIGVMDDNSNGWFNRNGCRILHCLNLKDICKSLEKEMGLYMKSFEPGFYRFESSPDLETCMELARSMLKDTNANIFFDRIKQSTSDIAVQCHLIKNFLCLSPSKDKKRVLSNWQNKKMYADINYFFKLINFGKINRVDPSVTISRDFVQKCRSHVRLRHDNYIFDNKNVREIITEKGNKKLTKQLDFEKENFKESMRNRVVLIPIDMDKNLNKNYKREKRNALELVRSNNFKREKTVVETYCSILKRSLGNDDNFGKKVLCKLMLDKVEIKSESIDLRVKNKINHLNNEKKLEAELELVNNAKSKRSIKFKRKKTLGEEDLISVRKKTELIKSVNIFKNIKNDKKTRFLFEKELEKMNMNFYSPLLKITDEDAAGTSIVHENVAKIKKVFFETKAKKMKTLEGLRIAKEKEIREKKEKQAKEEALLKQESLMKLQREKKEKEVLEKSTTSSAPLPILITTAYRCLGVDIPKFNDDVMENFNFIKSALPDDQMHVSSAIIKIKHKPYLTSKESEVQLAEVIKLLGVYSKTLKSSKKSKKGKK